VAQLFSLGSIERTMNFRSPFLPVAFFILLFTQGCGTVFTHANSKKATTPACTGIYRGTQTDAVVVGHLESIGAHLYKQPAGWGLMFVGIFVACDIPLSAVTDTVMWPYDRTTPPSQGWPKPEPIN
jgi:uncharacterized protein YceK